LRIIGGPFDESDEFAERLAGRLVATHSVPVDAERERRIRGAELVQFTALRA
jgi:hypothetical protein